MLTEEEVTRVMSKTTHPEIDYSLLDLGMIKEVVVEQETVRVTMNLPFPEVPIKDHLVRIVRDAIAEKDERAAVEVIFSVMNEAEQKEFRRKARDKWKL
jgi:metal-sulfur cluster biosynthetic enzyme